MFGSIVVVFVSSLVLVVVFVWGTFFLFDLVWVMDICDGMGIDGQYFGLFGVGQVIKFYIIGVGGVFEIGVGVVVLNVIVIEVFGVGYIMIYLCGDVCLVVLNVNYIKGVVVLNQVMVKVGIGGDVCFYVNMQVQIVVDLLGWYVDNFVVVLGFCYYELDFVCIFDNRDGIGLQNGWQFGLLVVGEVLVLQVEGVVGVFVDGVRVIIMNVIMVDFVVVGYLMVFLCDHSWFGVLNLNFDLVIEVVVNLVIVRILVDGQVCFFVSQLVNVIFDVQGYFVLGIGVEFTVVSLVWVMDICDGIGVDGYYFGFNGVGEVC